MTTTLPFIAAALPASLLAITAVPAVRKTGQIRVLQWRCRETRSLALTYDDGPGEELTPAVLELLAAADVRATFFPSGRSGSRSPELLARVAAAGHEIGCHSQEHLHAWRCVPWRIWRDVDAGYRTLAPWVPPNGLYRPPYGKITLATWWAVRRRGARFAWWTIDSGDTHATLPEPRTIEETVRRAGGGVVLMHDFDRDPRTRAERHAHVLDTTTRLLELARVEGLRVCTVGEVLGKKEAADRSSEVRGASSELGRTSPSGAV